MEPRWPYAAAPSVCTGDAGDAVAVFLPTVSFDQLVASALGSSKSVRDVVGAGGDVENGAGHSGPDLMRVVVVAGAV